MNEFIRDIVFRGYPYRIVYLNGTNDPTYIVFDDELTVRESYWHISEGDVVLDIGSGVGSYALPALAMGAKHAYAWAPQGCSYEVLKKSIIANGWTERADVYDYGLFDKSGYVSVETQQFTYNKPVFVDDLSGDVIKVIPLDDWASLVDCHKVDIMKLDVEGAEVEVLIGGKNLINECRPIITIENHIFKRPNVCNEIVDFLSSNNYREVCRIPYIKPHYPNISHSLWVPCEKRFPERVYPLTHNG